MKDIYLNRASETFNKSIPFKAYRLTHENISGRNTHTHDYMQIWYVKKGRLIHTVENSSHVLVKGTVFILSPFVVHRVATFSHEEVTVLGCEFSTDFINENIEKKNSFDSSLFDFAYLKPFVVSAENTKPGLLMGSVSQQDTQAIFEDMIGEYTREDKYFALAIKADLLKLLTVILREYDSTETPKQKAVLERYREAIHKTLDYVNLNYNRDMGLEDASRMAMMSTAYFSFIFKQITGKTFVEYRNELRIQKAIKFLGNYSLSVTDICFKVGFNDTAYFSKIFKKITGISPRKYRNIYLKKQYPIKKSGSP